MSDTIATTASVISQQPDSEATNVQGSIQVLLPTQTQASVNRTIQNTANISANPSTLLAATSGTDLSAQITQLTGIRIPGDSQQKLLLAQLQQLTKTTGTTTIPANASFVIQPTFQGITVVTTSPPTSTSTSKT